MDRGRTVKWVAIVDLALALLSIFYETLALTLRQNEQDGAGASATVPTLHAETAAEGDYYPADRSTRLLAYAMMKFLIYGLLLMQTYMGAKLFVAAKRESVLCKMRSRALGALQKFSCWRVWSWIFLFLLAGILAITMLMNWGQLKWTHWLLIALLAIQIAFRILGIYYVGLCRKDVKDGLVHPAFLIDSRHYPPPPPPLHLQQDLQH